MQRCNPSAASGPKSKVALAGKAVRASFLRFWFNAKNLRGFGGLVPQEFPDILNFNSCFRNNKDHPSLQFTLNQYMSEIRMEVGILAISQSPSRQEWLGANPAVEHHTLNMLGGPDLLNTTSGHPHLKTRNGRSSNRCRQLRRYFRRR